MWKFAHKDLKKNHLGSIHLPEVSETFLQFSAELLQVFDNSFRDKNKVLL